MSNNKEANSIIISVRSEIENFLIKLDEIARESSEYPARNSKRSLGGQLPSNRVQLQRAKKILAARIEREQKFGEHLFHDPAWDIFLELYIAHLEGSDLSVSSLCIGARVAPTTSLRYIQALEKKGDIVRKADPSDGRRSWLMLSTEIIRLMDEMMTDYFEIT